MFDSQVNRCGSKNLEAILMKTWTDESLNLLNQWSQIIGLVTLVLALLSGFGVYFASKELSDRAGILDKTKTDRIAELEEKLRVKPLDQRIRAFFEKLDHATFLKLSDGIETELQCDLDSVEESIIRGLCNEPGAEKLIQIVPRVEGESSLVLSSQGPPRTKVRLHIKPGLFPVKQ